VQVGRPGRPDDWLLAHEVGHVLDLDHVDLPHSKGRNFLMWKSVAWINVPPDISSGEAARMLQSGLTNPC
jgi:hypothetical protein